jgi:CO/xanthine dehydrogenase Mo-binding subunit
VLAGGQSLVPLLNMRLAAPEHIVDLNGLRGEPAEPEAEDGWVRFGPLVRQAAAERSEIVARHAPLVRAALHHVAHPAIRSRGTLVGRVAHADPAGELPAVLVALRGRQILGGFAQGLGGAVSEEIAYDGDGQIRNASFMDFLMPYATEDPASAAAAHGDSVPAQPARGEGRGRGGHHPGLGGHRRGRGRRTGRAVDSMPLSPPRIFEMVSELEDRGSL